MASCVGTCCCDAPLLAAASPWPMTSSMRLRPPPAQPACSPAPPRKARRATASEGAPSTASSLSPHQDVHNVIGDCQRVGAALTRV